MRQINPSITLAFNCKVREHVKLRKEIISLGLGEAEITTPPHIVEAGIKALRDGMTKYSTPQGLPALRERIAHRLKSSHGIATRAEQIIVTPGAKNALFLACAALIEPGDEVVLLRPCYVSNLPILQIASSGIQVRDVNLPPPHFNLNHDKLSSVITPKTKLIVLNSPNNPTGRMFSASDIEFLGDLLRRHPHLYALSDEVYSSISLGDPEHISLASISDISERVITVGGFSKTYFMTGWRIGYVHGCDALTRAMLTIHEHINTNTAVFIQFAVIAALDGDQECVNTYVQKLRERKDIYDQIISRSSYLHGTKYEGGYFTFIDISASQMDCDRFAVKLLDKENVAIVPGLAFGRNYSGYCRLSFVNKTEIFKEGLTRIQSFIEALANG